MGYDTCSMQCVPREPKGIIRLGMGIMSVLCVRGSEGGRGGVGMGVYIIIRH